MADLQDICSSGDLTEIFIGGTADGKKAAKVEDLALPKDSITFTAQDLAPAYEEGKLFYEDEHKSMSLYTDIAGVTHNLGQEYLVRVKNVSGATINNGEVCKLAEADLVTGFPQALLAQADTFEGAIILGVATHNIPDGTFGWLTQAGVVHNVDTSAFSPGDRVYLSETVPGGLVKSPTKILSRVGQVLLSNASTGSILVLTKSLAALPTIFGILLSPAGSYNLTAVYQNVINYGSKEEYNVTLNQALGTIATGYNGKYRITCNVTLNVPSAVSTRNIDLQVWDVTAGVQRGFYAINIPRNSEVVSRAFGVPVSLIAGNSVVIRIKSDDVISGVTFSATTIDVESILALV